MVERKSIEKERKRRGARSSLVVAFSSVFFLKSIWEGEENLFLLGFVFVGIFFKFWWFTASLLLFN